MPEKASVILDSCTTEYSKMLAPQPSVGGRREIVEQDYSLIQVCIVSIAGTFSIVSIACKDHTATLARCLRHYVPPV